MSNFVINPYVSGCEEVAWMSTLAFTPTETITISPAYAARGEATANGSSAMIGEVLTSVQCYLTDAEKGSVLDGTIYCEVWRLSTAPSGGGVKQHTLDSIEASELDNTKKLFTFSGSNYTMENYDGVFLRYDNVSTTKQIYAYRSNNTPAYDDPNSARAYWNTVADTWLVDTAEDLEDWLAIFSGCT